MRIVKAIVDFIMDILETISFVGSLFVVTYLFIMQPNQIKGASMIPTFHDKEFIFTSKVTYRFRPIERGDVVVFHAPEAEGIEYIKRVIGLPGDRIRITHDGLVFLNDHILNESYISARTTFDPDGYIEPNVEVVVPSNNLFVMGDNRPNSSDSRGFGPISMDSLIGQVFYRYFPFEHMGTIDNPLNAQELTLKYYLFAAHGA